MAKKAVCVISGGMDSALAAYKAKAAGYEIIALHFDYNQRTEEKEREAFYQISHKLGVKVPVVIDLPFFSKIGGSALTDSRIDVPVGGIEEGTVPITYVPFRNGIFLSIAASVAEKEGAEAIFIGVVEEDSSGYPDCTREYIADMTKAINEGTRKETQLSIETPLVALSKADIVAESATMGVPLELTWSCYKNSDVACGVCDSCRLRLKGFEKAGLTDPIEYDVR